MSIFKNYKYGYYKSYAILDAENYHGQGLDGNILLPEWFTDKEYLGLFPATDDNYDVIKVIHALLIFEQGKSFKGDLFTFISNEININKEKVASVLKILEKNKYIIPLNKIGKLKG